MPAQEPNGLLLFALCFVGALALIGALKLNHWWATRATRAPRQHYVVQSDRPTPVQATNEPEPPRSIAGSRVNHEEPRSSGSQNEPELVLNADEIEAIGRMIRHNATAAKPSKSSTIQAGFGVSRGGSSAYVRASLIYDSLFGQPEPAVVTPIAGRATRAPFASDRVS